MTQKNDSQHFVSGQSIYMTKYGYNVTDKMEITNDSDDDVDDPPSKVNIIIYVQYFMDTYNFDVILSISENSE